MIPLKHRLKYMLGIRFDRIKRMQSRSGATVNHGWYIFIGFYWFAIAFFRKWPLEWEFRCASGFIFSYWPNPAMEEGDLMWTRNKKYLRTDYLEDCRHAA